MPMIYGGHFRCLLCDSEGIWGSHFVASDETLDAYAIELAKFAKREMRGNLDGGRKLALARIGKRETYVATLSGYTTTCSISKDELERLVGEEPNSYETPAPEDGTTVADFLDLQRQLYDRPDGQPNVSLPYVERFGQPMPMSMTGIDLYQRARTLQWPRSEYLERYLLAADQMWSHGHPCALPKLLQYIAHGCNAQQFPYTLQDRQTMQAVEVQINDPGRDPSVAESCPECERFLPTLLCR